MASDVLSVGWHAFVPSRRIPVGCLPSCHGPSRDVASHRIASHCFPSHRITAQWIALDCPRKQREWKGNSKVVGLVVVADLSILRAAKPLESRYVNAYALLPTHNKLYTIHDIIYHIPLATMYLVKHVTCNIPCHTQDTCGAEGALYINARACLKCRPPAAVVEARRLHVNDRSLDLIMTGTGTSFASLAPSSSLSGISSISVSPSTRPLSAYTIAAIWPPQSHQAYIANVSSGTPASTHISQAELRKLLHCHSHIQQEEPPPNRQYEGQRSHRQGL